MNMKIDYDPVKREQTLANRGLDFARAKEVFSGHHFTAEDLRKDYDEARYITVGKLDERMVVLVWTPRDAVRRIISMRKANDREKEHYESRLD